MAAFKDKKNSSWYEDVIQHNNLWHFFRPRREKAAMRDDAR